MNRAATVVVGVLAFMVCSFTIRILWPGLPELPDKALRFMDVALGGLIGVIGKTGFDALKQRMAPGDKDEQQS